MPRLRPAAIAAIVVLVAGLAFAEWAALRGMVRLWSNSPMYSYGWLVPVIAGVLVWSRRDALAALPIRPAPLLGGLVLAAWAVLMVGGVRSGLQLAQQVALLPGIVGVVLVLCGAAHVRVAWAGLAYLLLMIPIWDGLTEPMHLRFQNLSAEIGVWLVRLVGVPAYREGIFIDLPNLKIEVARACSGINYLVAVVALGLPLGYLYLRSPWRRATLLAGAVVVAALSNGLRVALISVLAYYEVGSPLHGPFHVLHGLFVAGVGHVVLFVGLWFLMEPPEAQPAAVPPARPAGAPLLPARWLAFAGGLAVAFWAAGAYVHTYRPARIALAPGLHQLPRELGPWTSDPFAVPPALAWWEGADDQVSRIYRTADGRQAHVYVLYFASQEQNRELVSFRVTPLHRRSSATTVPRPGGDALPVNVAGPSAEDGARYALFWYDVGGAVEARPTAVKLRTMWHALLRGRTNGAAVYVTMEGAPGGGALPDGLPELAAQVQGALDPLLAGTADRPVAAASAVRRAGRS